MGWRVAGVTKGHVGSWEGKLSLILLHQGFSVVLASLIFLLPVESGWGTDAWGLSVPKSEQILHVTGVGFFVHEDEGKTYSSYRCIGECQNLRTILLADFSTRTSRSLVNTVMALLATFEEAGVLPPEGTAQANQIIHALIQLQAAVVKTSDPELQRFLAEAIRVKVGDNWEQTYRSLAHTGLTSMVMEALMTYASQSGMWRQQGVVLAFRQFNVTEEDWSVVENIFLRARDVYAQQGVSIHATFSAWLKKMS